MPSKIRHLLNRDGRYYARVSIPSALRPALGKRELLEPLGADRGEALRKHPAAVARMQAALEAARGQVRSEAPRERTTAMISANMGSSQSRS
jgi:hypothetical protein